jgi:phosphoribosylpyrophosphate synthetase
MRRRGNISLKLIAEMCVKAGFTHIITIDLHSKVIIVFFLSVFGSGSALILVGWIRIHEGKKDL